VSALREWAKNLSTQEGTQEGPREQSAAPQYVTLNHVAAYLKCNKRTLERWMHQKGSEGPEPDIEGGGGKPHQWVWSKLRPWLQRVSRRTLPERFPERFICWN